MRILLLGFSEVFLDGIGPALSGFMGTWIITSLSNDDIDVFPSKDFDWMITTKVIGPIFMDLEPPNFIH